MLPPIDFIDVLLTISCKIQNLDPENKSSASLQKSVNIVDVLIFWSVERSNTSETFHDCIIRSCILNIGCNLSISGTLKATAFFSKFIIR